MYKLSADPKAKVDQLNRHKFAQDIARLLVLSAPDANESLVFGLNGSWGSGKSSLLGFIQEEIKGFYKQDTNNELGVYEIFEFNPWMFSGQEQLQRYFLGELFRKLGGKEGKFKEAVNRLSKFVKRFVPTKQLLPEEWEEAVEKIIAALSGEETIEQLKKAVDELLIEENLRLYIIMDDIDRLSPDEIVQVFQLVKLNANFKNTIFLLAYDKEVVVSALEQKFKGQGERYLAKIVQADYTLPEMLEEQVENLFFRELENRLKSLKIPFIPAELMHFWQRHGMKKFFQTPRDIHRYLNGLVFRLPVVWQDVNVAQFLVVEAIRTFDFGGFQNMYEISLDCLRKTHHFPSFRDDDVWTKGRFSDPTTLELVRELAKRPTPDSLREMYVDVKKDVFTNDGFERYFSLQLSKKDVSEQEFRDFLTYPEESLLRLQAIHINGRLKNLFRRLLTPGWEKDFPEIGLPTVEGFVNFLHTLNETEQGHHLAYLFDFINQLLENKQKKPHEQGIIRSYLLDLGTGYPQTVRFLWLFHQWQGFQKKWESSPNSLSLEEKDVVDALMAYSTTWIDNVVNDLPKCYNSELGHRIIQSFALFEPSAYPDFMLNKFKKPIQMGWLLSKNTMFGNNGEASRWRSEGSLFPAPVFEHFRKTLIEEPLDKLAKLMPPDHFSAVRFFISEDLTPDLPKQ